MGNKVGAASPPKPTGSPTTGSVNPVKHVKHKQSSTSDTTSYLENIRKNCKKKNVNGREARKLTKTGQDQMEDVLDGLNIARKEIEDIQHKDYEYPFENIVLEGGGAKGIAYVGSLRALNEVGVKLKRFAGASAGAICAALAAVGYTADEMEVLLSKDIAESINDHSCGICSLLPNLIQGYGWNPGKVFLKDLGKYIADKSGGNADLTFKQLLVDKQIELCVIATNMNMMSVEYFHPKTTPDMPIRLAVRISSSIPGILKAVQIPADDGKFTTYIDGGLLCNYPIHAFDGWWLSMDSKDSFLQKITDLNSMQKLMAKKDRFGTYNEKTVGFLVYSSLEQEVMQAELQSRVGIAIEKRPDTALFRKRKRALEAKLLAQEEHEVFIHTLNKFLLQLRQVDGLLKKANLSADGAGDDFIDKSELKQVINNAVGNSEEKLRMLEVERLQRKKDRLGLSPENNDSDDSDAEDPEDDPNFFTTAHIEILFGSDRTLDQIFDELDVNNDSKISFGELVKFIENFGISIQSKFQGYDRRDVTNLKEFAIGLQDCLLTNVKRVFIEDKDLMRTVGINTDYLETTDFVMEEEDRKFLMEQGYRATVSYLKHYVHEKNPPKRSDIDASSSEKNRRDKIIMSQPLPPGLSILSTDNSVSNTANSNEESSAHQKHSSGREKGALPPIRGKAAAPAQMTLPPISAGPDLRGRRPDSVNSEKPEQPTTTTSLDSTD